MAAKKTISIRVSPEMLEEVEAEQREGETRNATMERLLRKALDADKDTATAETVADLRARLERAEQQRDEANKAVRDALASVTEANQAQSKALAVQAVSRLTMGQRFKALFTGKVE